ncbi:hypothetical protein [Aeromicrobium halocynthiae]|uniref:hypothetical protein n=1 Tax=Aeromicrobium halocynthiae TaxID=560557 RepID=UPI0031D688F9
MTESEPSETTAQPAARWEVDGVETWDLTGEPSEAALGIEEDSRAGIHESDEPREVVLLLPDDTRVEVTTKVLSFERARTADGDDRFRIGLRGPTVPAEELVEKLRAVTEQLGVASADLDTFAQELDAAPADQTERIRYASPTAELGALTISVSANLAPIAEGGRLVIGGAWMR